MDEAERKYIAHLNIILNKIKSELLHTASTRPIQYRISHTIAPDYPSGREEIELIYKLEEEDIIKVRSSGHNFFQLEVNKEALKKKLSELDNPFIPLKNIVKTSELSNKSTRQFEYDIAFSLAGEQKQLGQEIKDELARSNLHCWIYSEREAELAGSEMPEEFQLLFTEKTKYVVILISEDYVKKTWTELERQHILDRRMVDKNFLIPVKLDGSELVGLPKTTGYISGANRSAKELAEIILQTVSFKEGKSSDTKYESEETFVKPKLTKIFNPYEEKDQWIGYIGKELKKRIDSSGLHFHETGTETKKIRVLLNGKIVHSLNIYPDSMGNEKGISFYGITGEINNISNNSYNAFGEFKWNKEKATVTLDLFNASLFPNIAEKKEYSKSEFVDAIWEQIVKHLDENF